MAERAVSEGMARRYVAECVGTFGVVFAPVALAASGSQQGVDTGPLVDALVSGLAVLAMVYALGHISGAHFNPAVSLALAAANRFPWRCVLPYCASQFIGGVVAAGVAAVLYGGGHGAHVPAVAAPAAVATEALLTFLLMFVIISVATDKRVNGAIPGLAIGLTVLMDILIGGSLTGGSMNPARSLGPALFASDAALSTYWVYVAGPVLGAVAAARLYEAIRGGEEHAQSAPKDLYPALRAFEQGAESEV